jgi:hypothetical protein
MDQRYSDSDSESEHDTYVYHSGLRISTLPEFAYMTIYWASSRFPLGAELVAGQRP